MSSSSPSGSPQSWPERWYNNTLQALFGLGFTFSKEVQDDSRFIFIVTSTIAEVQMLGFALNDSDLLPWRNEKLFRELVSALSYITQPLNPKV